MPDNYLKNYLVLGVKPGASWKQLRQAYKKMVNVWHPDRFQQDIRQKRLAEEKTKEITHSYKELAEYRRKFGALPFATSSAIPAAENVAPQSTSDTPPVPEKRDTEPAVVVTLTSWRPTLAWVITVTAMASIVYLMWQLAPSEQESVPVMEKHTNQAVNIQDDGNPDQNTATETRFTIGSTLGEVYTIQGVPTRTEKDVWYYGESRVYFSNGKVSHWNESQENPLRATITPGAEKPAAKFFGKGSSKEEVRAVQGVPDRDAGSVWDYGLSRVYFEKDRVTGWNEMPLNPLKVRPH